MLKSTFGLLFAISLGFTAFTHATPKKVSDAKTKMIDTRISEWKPGFLKVCAEQMKAKPELKAKNASQVCQCIVQKHRNYLVKKAKDDETVDVPAHLKELLDLYAAPDTDGADQGDEPKILDLDIDIATSCLAKAK